MSTIAICLYSKYSQRCKEFLDEIPDLDIQLIPIDHEEIRNTIIRDNEGYHIKSVPCVFLLFPNGRLEKYEGSDAFVWVRKVKEVLQIEQSTSRTTNETEEQPLPIHQQQSSRIELPDEDQPKVKVEKMMESQKEMRERGSDQFITKKQENIKELAQAMQRQRESEEEQVPNPPLTQSLPIDRP